MNKKQISNARYAITVETKFIASISRAKPLNLCLSSRIFAASREAYVLIPRTAIRMKYSIMEFAKLTFPIPSGIRTREAYGNDTIGKIMLINDFKRLKKAFFVSDFCLIFILLIYSDKT